MALAALSGDEQRIVFSQLCNVLDPGVAVDFSSASSGLWASTQALRQQLKADHEVVAVLCRKMGMWRCKVLRKAGKVCWNNKGLSAANLALLGTLGSVLPALKSLRLIKGAAGAAGHDGVQRLVAGLGVGALPSVITFALDSMHVGDAGASALAAALGRGALPRLKILKLSNAAIGDAGLAALAPALRLRPALEYVDLSHNPLGDEGIAALVAPPPPPAGAVPPPTGGLTKLKMLSLSLTQITDAGCATLAAAIDSGALPILENLELQATPASAVSPYSGSQFRAVNLALVRLRAAVRRAS